MKLFNFLECEEFKLGSDIWQMLAGSPIFPSRDTYRLSNVTTFKFFTSYPSRQETLPKRVFRNSGILHCGSFNEQKSKINGNCSQSLPS